MFTEDEEPANFRGAEVGQRAASVHSRRSITRRMPPSLTTARAHIVMSRAKAALGAPILASILGSADGARDPMDLPLPPP